MQLPALAAWSWIPIVVGAALAQTVRNAAQRTLTAEVGTLPATLVRFLYGLPFALFWLLVVCSFPDASGNAVPPFGLAYFAWIATGAVSQLIATALLLLAMKERNFIIAVTFTKTEVLQVALMAALFLHELPGWLSGLAMFVATAGVVLLSVPKAGALEKSGMVSRTALYGLASGACFALAAVGYRGAALTQAGISGWLIGAWGVLWAQLLQSLLLGSWLAHTQPASLIAIARAWRLSTIAGSMGALASIGWMTASALRPAADVRTLGLVEVLFSYMVSRRLFREKLTGRELTGLLLVSVGLVVICSQL